MRYARAKPGKVSEYCKLYHGIKLCDLDILARDAEKKIIICDETAFSFNNGNVRKYEILRDGTMFGLSFEVIYEICVANVFELQGNKLDSVNHMVAYDNLIVMSKACKKLIRLLALISGKIAPGFD